MEKQIYRDIAARAGGGCKVAVVGPPACGRHTAARALAESSGAEYGEDGSFSLQEGVSVAVGDADALAGADAAVLVTADGSFGGLSRAEIAAAEGEIAAKLAAAGVPFIVLVNSADPASDGCRAVLAAWGERALAANAAEGLDADEVFSCLLLSFPPVRLDIILPDWMGALPEDSKLAADILARVRAAAPDIDTLRGCASIGEAFADGDLEFVSCETDAATGRARCRFAAKEGAFYRVLSEECGEEIGGDLQLMAYVRALKDAKRFHERFANAFAAAEAGGYAVVQAGGEAQLHPPELVRRGAKCGIRLRADAPSYHIVRVDVHSDVSPITGEGEQGEQLARNMLECCERDADVFWNTELFGRTFRDMVCDGLREKTVPPDAREKLRRALTRIVNEGRGGVLCILL